MAYKETKKMDKDCDIKQDTYKGEMKNLKEFGRIQNSTIKSLSPAVGFK